MTSDPIKQVIKKDLFGHELEDKTKRKLRVLQKNVYSFQKNDKNYNNKKYEMKFCFSKMKNFINDPILMLITLKYLNSTKMAGINK